MIKPSKLLRQFVARARLASALGAGVLAFFLLPHSWPPTTAGRLLLCWNVTVLVYLVLAVRVLWTGTASNIRERAKRQDEGQKTILLLTVTAVIASLVAIVLELATIPELAPELRKGHILLTAVTVVSSWLFMHLMFALHYAHEFYHRNLHGQPGGLHFPGETEPDYWDFVYFSAVIGTSGQTADVEFTSKAMRRTGLVHCVLAYFYNTTVLALTINIASGLI